MADHNAGDDGEPPTPKARVRLPPWIGGHDIPGYLQLAGLKATPVDLPAGWWDVSTIESYEHRPANLVSAVQLIGATFDPSLLNGPIGGLPAGGSGSLESPPVQTEIQKLLATKDLPAVTSAYSLATLTAKDDQLGEVIEGCWTGLREMTDGTSTPIFSDCNVHLVRVPVALPHRYNFCRAMLRLEDDPPIYDNPPASDGVNFNFASSMQLFTDTTLGLDAYLDPLFLALSPWMWGFDGPRLGGVVVYSFGKAVAGRTDVPTELLQLHSPRGSLQEGGVLNDVTPASIDAALRWWTTRLDRLFSVVTNPANYAGRDGFYQPRRHFEVLLGVEQLFRHVGSILGQVRDQNARRLLFFGAMDTLEGLGGIGQNEGFSIDHAEAALGRVEADLNEGEEAVLLPNARRAIEGLRAVQDGFFLPSRVSSAGVQLPGKTGDETVSKGSAAASWLVALRNATHGFRAKRRGNWARGEALFAAHTGALPESVSLIAYLWLLELLASPHRAESIVRTAAKHR